MFTSYWQAVRAIGLLLSILMLVSSPVCADTGCPGPWVLIDSITYTSTSQTALTTCDIINFQLNYSVLPCTDDNANRYHNWGSVSSFRAVVSWDFGDGTALNDFNGASFPAHRYKNPGLYNVTVLLMSYHAAVDYNTYNLFWEGPTYDTKTIQVTIAPELKGIKIDSYVPSFYYGNLTNQTTLGNQFQFGLDGLPGFFPYCQGGAGYTWSWDFGDVDPATGQHYTSTEPNPTHLYACAGTYNVTATISRKDNNETATVTTQVTVNITTPTANLASGSMNGVSVYWYSVPGNVKYNVYRSDDGGSPALIGSATKGMYQDSDPNLRSGVYYCYTVTAVDQCGNESPASDPMCTQLPLPPPTIRTYGASTDEAPTSGDDANANGPGPNAQALTAHAAITQNTANPLPSYYSGTNCLAGGETDIPAKSDFDPISAELLINGEWIAGAVLNPMNKGVKYTIEAHWDSTHFRNGTKITETFKLFSINPGRSPLIKSYTREVYNRAYILGNTGDLRQGLAAAAVANLSLKSATAAAGGPVFVTLQQSRQRKTALLANLPKYTILYTWTHAAARPYASFGDCLATRSSTNDYYLFALTDPTGANTIQTEIQAKSFGNKPLPAYNFVFVDGCNSAEYPDMATSFQVLGKTSFLSDRAFLGWDVNAPDKIEYVNWTAELFSNLKKKQTLAEAAFNADQAVPRPKNSQKQIVHHVIKGDHNMQILGLYGETNPHIWHRRTRVDMVPL